MSALKYCVQFWAPQYKIIGQCQNNGYKDGEGSREQNVCEVVEVTSLVQPRAEETEED